MAEISPAAPRRGYIDALKGLGILLVVFGHFEEYYRGTSALFNGSYECIYLFHMALFCIASGLVAKLTLRKLIAQQLWLYAVCQVLMFLFRLVVMKENFAETGGTWSALVLPWRHMWYLFALLFWELTVPVLTLLRGKLGLAGSVLGFAAAVALGLWSGTKELPFALVRVFSFYPFYAFGVLFRQELDMWHTVCRRQALLRWLPALTAAVVYGGWFRAIWNAAEPVYEGVRIWQDAAYRDGYTMLDRGLFYLTGILTTLALLGVMGGCRSLQSLGRRTLPVYVFHMPILAFLIELGVFALPDKPLPAILAWVLLLTGGTVCLLASTPICTAFGWISNFWYKTLPALWSKRRTL